jgi:hypothetical protein
MISPPGEGLFNKTYIVVISISNDLIVKYIYALDKLDQGIGEIKRRYGDNIL